MKEIKMTNELAMQKVIERAKNNEFSNEFELSKAILQSIIIEDNVPEVNKKADEKRREQIISWLDKLSKAFTEGNLQEAITVDKVLEKIDNKELLTEDETLSLVAQMLGGSTMHNVMNMLSCLLTDSALSFILNPEEDYFLSIIHGFDNSNVERTSVVLDLGKGNSNEVICDNFFKGFLAVFLLNDVSAFYESNLSLEAMKENKVIENLVQYTLANIK